MKLTAAVSTLALVATGVLADAVPWASANAVAAAAAEAYAEAIAEAHAIAHPDPEAYALAASADDCATFACHAACGFLILDGQACTQNTTDVYSGPYNTTCLCAEGSNFIERYHSCMTCGWTLWKYYGPYVTSALEACGTLSTEPTGTLRCSTTLTDSYTVDSNAGCAYGGLCTTVGSNSSNATLTGSASSFSNSTTAASTGGSSSASFPAETSSSAAASSAAGSSSSASSSASNGAQLLVAGSSVAGAIVLGLLM